MTEGYSIREARVEDVPRLVEFRKNLTDHSVGANPDSLRRSKSALEELPGQYEQWIASTSVCFAVAEHQVSGEVVAMVIGHDLKNLPTVPAHLGEISDAWVQPEHRRSGLGRALVHLVARFFVDAGVARVILDFVAGNPEAEAFWLGFGLRPMLTAVSGDPKEFLEATRGRD